MGNTVNINFDLKDVAEIKIGKRTFKKEDLSKANTGDFLLYVGEAYDMFTVGRLYSIYEVLIGSIYIRDDDDNSYRVEPDDDEFILFKPDYTERDREFIRLGRLPEQFKVGDIVQDSKWKIGAITEIDKYKMYCVNFGADYKWRSGEVLRLIAPAEHANKVK